jgi:hypothetical protein
MRGEKGEISLLDDFMDTVFTGVAGSTMVNYQTEQDIFRPQ